jgi:FlaA1/EpsC-like NDP-sugar epimerase
MVVVLVIQIAFYYFDLYDLRIFRERKKMGILLLESLGVSAIFLAVVYYFIPLLTIGRGIFAISLILVFVFTFLWRLLYAMALKAWVNKEKILIVGTGELAKKIRGEILENGYDGFEIVGFIDENRDKIGDKV